MQGTKRGGADPRQGTDPENLKNYDKGKVIHFSGQRERVLLAFSGLPQTMLQVSVITSTDRANICRYVSYFRKHDLIILKKTGLCPLSSYRAGFYLATGKELLDEL